MSENKKLKVLFLPSWYPSNENPVAGVFIKEHAKAVSLFDEVIVLYHEGISKEIKIFYKLVSDKKEDGIRTIRIKSKKSPIPKTSYILYILSIKKAFKNLLKSGWKPDIIHAHVYIAGVPAVILGKKYKIPVVITEHFSAFPRKALKKTEILKAKFAFRKANIILPVSNSLKKSIEFYGIKNNFKIVPNVVDLNIFYPPKEKKIKIDSKKRILTVALLDPIKGIPYLLKALAKVRKLRKDFILDIVGDGPKRKDYEKLTKKLGLQNLVRFHGIQPKEKIAEFMRNCSFYVQPSLYETFGVTFIEAMACGKPIIGTLLPSLKELISKERGILVPPKNIYELSKAINYMLDHYNFYSKEKIFEYVKNNFSHQKVGKLINNIYYKIINKF